jgi:two-component system chemotaxis response regulator CheY
MPTCLVVDDEEDHRDIGNILCKAMNMETVSASHGLEALDKCKEEMPDMVLLDWMMPKMDGIRFLRELRALPGGDAVYVLITSARGDDEAKDIALRAGANAYLPKPFNPPDLMTRILDAKIV